MVNEEIINKYFDKLEMELQSLPPKRTFNYDETNRSDNLGRQKNNNETRNEIP